MMKKFVVAGLAALTFAGCENAGAQPNPYAPYSGYNLPASVTFDDEAAIRIAGAELRRQSGEDGYWSEVPLKATRDQDGNWRVVGTRNKVTLDYARNVKGRGYTDAELMKMIERGQITREGGHAVIVIDARTGKVLSSTREG